MHSFGDHLMVVMDERAGRSISIGIVSQHDLLGVMARSEDPARLTVSDIMCPHAPFVAEGDDVLETLCWMRRHGLHDVVVLGQGGAPLGTVSLDQLADNVAGELSDAAAYLPGTHASAARGALH
jgi:CBS domain-containing protein